MTDAHTTMGVAGLIAHVDREGVRRGQPAASGRPPGVWWAWWPLHGGCGASTLSQAVDELKAGLAEVRALARGLPRS